MEILDAAMDQPLNNTGPTMESVFDSAALIQPDLIESSQVRSEPIFDLNTNIVNEQVSLPVDQMDMTSIIDAINNINIPSPTVNVANQSTESLTQFSDIPQSIENSLTQIDSNTQINNESTRIITEFSTELAQSYSESVSNNNSAISNLQNLDTYLKNVSSSNTESQQNVATSINNTLQSMVESKETTNQQTSSQVVNEFNEIINAGDQTSRVESNQLISQTETNQLIRPANPVVSSIEVLSKEFNRGIQDMSTNISSNMSNLKSGDSVTNTEYTTIDQSSMLMQGRGEEPTMLPQESNQDKPVQQAVNGLSEMYLAAIYELLASGIKVKISH